MKRLFFTLRFLLIVCLLAGVVSACSSPEKPGQDITPAATLDTPTPQPTATVTPLPGRTVLVAPLSVDVRLFDEVQAALINLTRESGMVLDVREAIAPADIAEDWHVVIFLSTPANLDELLNAGAALQFVLVDQTERQAGSNLSIIRYNPEFQAFMAGFMTTLTAFDFRSAGLLVSDTPNAERLKEAFLNGAAYYCGRCAPVYSPVVLFPKHAAMPGGSGLDAWSTTLNEMNLNYVYTYYVAPEVATPELLTYLAASNLKIIGGQTPPDEARSTWVATVRQDPTEPLIELWPELMAAQGGKTLDAAISASDVNPEVFTPGRQRFFDETLQALRDGMVNPISPDYP